MNNSRPPLLVITGPTASGKSGLALRLAEKWSGEILCADSRTVYRHMDIGTAKPTTEERRRVPHWLLDVVEPGERFTVADFQKQAIAAIADIRSRGKIPLLVGGTGLYVDSVVLGFSFGPEADTELRVRLENMTVDELQKLLTAQQIPLPENAKNKRYLIRSYEKNNVPTSRKELPDTDTHVVALQVDGDELSERILTRATAMFSSGVLQETQQLLTYYDSSCEALSGNIYPIVAQLLAGELTEPEAIDLVVQRDRQLAKRQVTWLKRHRWVSWLSSVAAEQYFDNILSKYRDARTKK